MAIKKYFTIIIGIVIGLGACKKNDNTQSPIPQIDPADANAVSAAIKVWHSAVITGTLPGSTSNPETPQLDEENSDKPIYTYKSGYTVIRPQIISGNIKGYYLKIKGASDYFKIDYSIPLKRPAKPSNVTSKPKHVFRPTDDPNNNDSIIVIQLPAGIAPGTFCVTYWAYDDEGNVSNGVDQCFVIKELGAGNDGSWVGKWKLKARKELDFIDGQYTNDTTWNENIDDSLTQFNIAVGKNILYCNENYVSNYPFTEQSPIIEGYPSNYEYVDEVAVFSANGAFSDKYNYISHSFAEASTCNQVVYERTDDAGETIGGWSYDAINNKFYAIFHADYSVSETDVLEYDVIEKTTNTIILRFKEFDQGNVFTTYVKLVKQ